MIIQLTKRKLVQEKEISMSEGLHISEDNLEEKKKVDLYSHKQLELIKFS